VYTLKRRSRTLSWGTGLKECHKRYPDYLGEKSYKRGPSESNTKGKERKESGKDFISGGHFEKTEEKISR